MVFHDSKIYEGESTPLIVYIHSGGFKEVFHNKTSEAFNYVEENIPAIQREINQGRLTPSSPQYGIIIVWGHKSGRRSIDAFVYGDLNTWEENPEIVAKVFREGIPITSENQVIGCGDAMIMQGI